MSTLGNFRVPVMAGTGIKPLQPEPEFQPPPLEVRALGTPDPLTGQPLATMRDQLRNIALDSAGIIHTVRANAWRTPKGY
jgi:hypothetical protein